MGALCRCGNTKDIPEAEFCGVCHNGIKRIYQERLAGLRAAAVEEWFALRSLPKAVTLAAYEKSLPAVAEKYREPPPGMPKPSEFRRRVVRHSGGGKNGIE